MTSRISYSKLSRENRKRMLGMTIITVLTFFIKAVFYIIDGIWEAKQCILSKSFRHLQEDSLKLMI